LFLHFLEYPIYLLDETKIESEKFLVKENGDFPNHMAFVQKKDSDYLVILDPGAYAIQEWIGYCKIKKIEDYFK